MTLSTTASTRLGCAASVIFSFRASLCASKLKAGVSVDMAVTAYRGSFKTRDCTRAYHQRETRRFSFLFSEQHTGHITSVLRLFIPRSQPSLRAAPVPGASPTHPRIPVIPPVCPHFDEKLEENFGSQHLFNLQPGSGADFLQHLPALSRSEERRVGKECPSLCRSR